MSEPDEVPDGAAVFPRIPAELGVHPLLLAVLHAVVFISGSEPDVVNDDAGSEALEYLAEYLQRLQGDELRRVREDIATLLLLAGDEKWPRDQVDFLRSFLADFGVGVESEGD